MTVPIIVIILVLFLPFYLLSDIFNNKTVSVLTMKIVLRNLHVFPYNNNIRLVR